MDDGGIVGAEGFGRRLEPERLDGVAFEERVMSPHASAAVLQLAEEVDSIRVGGDRDIGPEGEAKDEHAPPFEAPEG